MSDRPAPRLQGLTADEVLERRAEFGRNELAQERPTSAWQLLLNQFKSPLIYIILAAAGISLALGEFSDFAIIAAVVIVDVALGFTQEHQAHRAYNALRGLLRPTATVIREGKREEVDVADLVPGDLVVLAVGDRVPADLEVLEATRLGVDEAILTGESEPVSKHADGDEQSAEGADPRASEVFMGSTVVTGRAIGRVTATGAATELGAIAATLSRHEELATPLQIRLEQFSRVLTRTVVAVTLAVLGLGLVASRPFLEMLRMSIILAIAAVPEGLIIAVTVIMVLGMRRVLRRQGLVKRLLAVETLGSVTVICTDKTGTLTEGRMRVREVDLQDRTRALQTMVLCNNIEGPVDVALWEYAEQQLGPEAQALFDRSKRFAEELFTSETKYMIAAVTSNELGGEHCYFLKGAPELVLAMTDSDPAERSRIMAEIDGWAGAGMRLLGLATRRGGGMDVYSGYQWAGLVGMEDPIREGVVESVALARRAGIETKMITGDYRRTAGSIAAGVGIANASHIIEGAELAAMDTLQLQRAVRDCQVFARIRPQDKLRIVQALQADGEVVAMIGDGVNDAPAIALANIGVVVGTATDVAKESADLILLDGNFKTVVAAVEEGRVIFDNIKKVVAYVLSNSFAELLTIFVAMLLDWPAPLLVSQILWIHLICDGPADIVLGFEPRENGVMEAAPRDRAEPVLDRLGTTLIAVISLASAGYALAVFGYFHLVWDDQVAGRSVVFASFCVNTLVYLFSYRSLRTPLWRMHPVSANRPLLWSVAAGLVTTALPFAIPALGRALGVVPLDLPQWLLVFGFALALVVIVELAKLVATAHAKL